MDGVSSVILIPQDGTLVEIPISATNKPKGVPSSLHPIFNAIADVVDFIEPMGLGATFMLTVDAASPITVTSLINLTDNKNVEVFRDLVAVGGILARLGKEPCVVLLSDAGAEAEVSPLDNGIMCAVRIRATNKEGQEKFVEWTTLIYDFVDGLTYVGSLAEDSIINDAGEKVDIDVEKLLEDNRKNAEEIFKSFKAGLTDEETDK